MISRINNLDSWKLLNGFCFFILFQLLLEWVLLKHISEYLIAILFIAIAYVASLKLYKVNKILYLLFTFSFILRLSYLGFSAPFFYILGLDFGYAGQSDPVTFANMGWDYASYWRTDDFNGEKRLLGDIFNKHFYYYYNSIIYYLPFKQVTWLPLLMNIFFGSLIPLVVWSVFTEFGFSKRVSSIAGIFAMLDPRMIAFSSMNMKTILLALSVALLVLFVLRLRNLKLNYQLIVILAIPVFVLSMTRSAILYLLFVAMMFGLIDSILARLKFKFIYRIPVWLLFVVLVLYAPHDLSRYIMAHVNGFLVAINLNSLALGDSIFAIVGSKSPIESPYLLPIITFFSLLGHFPPWRIDATWLSYSLRPGVIWFHFIVILSCVGAYRIYKEKIQLKSQGFFWVFGIINLAAAIIITRGTPEVIRYMAPFYYIFYGLSACGIEKLQKTTMSKIAVFYVATMFLLSIVYYFVKYIFSL